MQSIYSAQAPENVTLREAIEMKLARHPISHRYQLKVDEFEGAIQLYGNVDTYYEKQLAQHLVMEIPEVRTLDNHLVVRSHR